MLITHEREKTINAILFFAHRVKFLGKTKLFKLLYFLDFGHYQETGRSVTGLDYHAWKMGPVPVALAEEIDAPEADLCEKISFEEIPSRGRPMLKVTPLGAFDGTHFSSREVRIMERLVEEFRDTRAEDIVEATHLENLPWHRVYVEEGGRLKRIPYDYAFRKQEVPAMQAVVAERESVVDHFKKVTP